MKYKKYILILLITLFIGCNKTYAAAEYEKRCYYISNNEDFKAELILRTGFGVEDMETGEPAIVYVDKKGEKLQHKKKEVNNWYDGNLRTNTSKGGFKFDTYYDNFKQANTDENPSCPRYLVLQDCAGDKIFATDDKSLAEKASAAINNKNSCNGYYAVGGYTAEEYYGSFADLTPDGTPTDVTCDTLFGDKNNETSIAYMVNQVLGYVRIIVPILIILFGTIDLAKCVMAGREDEIRKAQSTFIKRLIAGVAVFFVPLLVNIIMELADIVWEGLGYSSCKL